MPKKNSTLPPNVSEGDPPNGVEEHLERIWNELVDQRGRFTSIQDALANLVTLVEAIPHCDPSLLVLVKAIHEEVISEPNDGTLASQIGQIRQAVYAAEAPGSAPSLYQLAQETRRSVANEDLTRTALSDADVIRTSVGEGDQAVLAKATAIAAVAGEIRSAVANEDLTRTVIKDASIIRTSVGEGAQSVLSKATAIGTVAGEIRLAVANENLTQTVFKDAGVIRASVGEDEQSVLAKTQLIHVLAEGTYQQVAATDSASLRGVMAALREKAASHENLLKQIAKVIGGDVNDTSIHDLVMELKRHFNIGVTVQHPPPQPY